MRRTFTDEQAKNQYCPYFANPEAKWSEQTCKGEGCMMWCQSYKETLVPGTSVL